MRNAAQPENQYPTLSQGKKIASHQNQFGNKNQAAANNTGLPSSKMSPA